jgi:hypothetical protein
MKGASFPAENRYIRLPSYSATEKSLYETKTPVYTDHSGKVSGRGAVPDKNGKF